MIAAGLAIGWFPSCGQQNASYPYRPAMYTSGSSGPQLKVFPLSGTVFTIPLPFALENITYALDGKALYATRQFLPLSFPGPPVAKLFKVEFDPIRVSPVPGSEGLGVIYSLAVSARQDKIIALGTVLNSNEPGCPIIELTVATGTLRTIVQNYACRPFDPLVYVAHLSLSPDSTRAIAMRNHHVDLIDLSSGKSTSVGDGEQGSWSPDGKWIAIRRGERTILLDASTLSQWKAVGAADLEWSPDSRYLLNSKAKPICMSELGTLEMVDVETGKRTDVESSSCLINRNVGWLTREVTR
jgi:hypothetical protein